MAPPQLTKKAAAPIAAMLKKLPFARDLLDVDIATPANSLRGG
jgi:hypothetical protein